jgi:predicted Zn-dependent peptidase
MRITKHGFITLSLLLSSLISFPGVLLASDYSPPGLYDVEHLTLDNGIDVIMKPRQGAHTFSIRVWVGVGTQDFSCERQATPHFLEHLLFTGTSKYSEAELEHRVADHGGSWNAVTGREETTYQMDIYSRHNAFAIDTLYEILTDSIISEEDVETSRAIIHRESGGKPSKIKQWFRKHGFGVNATEKAVLQLLPGINFICEGYVTAEGITRDDIMQTFDKYYVPGNMAIIVVGDFDKLQVIEQLLQTFGSIPPKAVPERTEPQASATSSYKTVTGTFSPLLSSDTSIGVMYRLPGYWSEDNFALMIIEQYLDFKINETIRIDRGLSYAPGTWAYNFSDYGLFGVNADVDSDDIDEALSLIKKEMSQLAEQPMNEALMQEAKLKILLRNVQGYEANMDFADYYANQYLLFRKHRYYEDVEEKIEAVTVDDIRRVVDEYLRDDKAVTLIESPTLTYTQFYVVLSLLVVFVGLIIVIFYVRTHARFRAKKIS